MRKPTVVYTFSIRVSIDAQCRDDTSKISRDPRTKRLQTRRESLARPSKHTFRLISNCSYISLARSYLPQVAHAVHHNILRQLLL